MRGRAWSKEIREMVIHASQLGVEHTIIEAITGVNKRGIQRILSESKGGDQPRQRHEREKLLGDQHCDVSWGWELKQPYTYPSSPLVSESLFGA
jgi:hypothetical protein